MGKILRHVPVNPIRNLLSFRKRGISCGVKLIIGFIFKQDIHYNKARVFLEKSFGKIDFESPALDFNHTDYYEEEFGKGLKRKFISFRKLIFPQDIPKIKNIANRIEARLSSASRRLINIDPGYLNLGKLILATTKDHKHRIYLGRGIYAEVTLFYSNKSFKPWEWTYPDYQTAEYIAIFNQIREIYARQIKDKPHKDRGWLLMLKLN